jgi:hypothetical protein
MQGYILCLCEDKNLYEIIYNIMILKGYVVDYIDDIKYCENKKFDNLILDYSMFVNNKNWLLLNSESLVKITCLLPNGLKITKEDANIFKKINFYEIPRNLIKLIDSF